MDGPSLEHSDSDSGESWTLLEHNPTLAEEALELNDHPIKIETEKVETHEKDEDTDGISIISDSDPESISPCQVHFKTLYEEDQHPDLSQCPLNLPFPEHDVQHDFREDDFLGIDKGKHKTYVHRRNKRLSTVLNIIVLGSVITAAGVAFGHMWGAKTDCAMNTTPNVNNILSNLYKLQEENAYLRNKLKELTALNNQNCQLKGSKNSRCSKVFEEPLNNDKNDKPTKCIEGKPDLSRKLLATDNKWAEPAYEKEFKENINKLKNTYFENRNWLDDEIALRLQQQVQTQKRMRHSRHATKLKKINEEKDPSINEVNPENKNLNDQHAPTGPDVKVEKPKIISYADSLNHLNEMDKKDKQFKIKNNTINNNRTNKVKKEKVIESGYEHPVSEEDIGKDTRYNSPKFKRGRKKNDRQKTYKKQKRRNKYEQWEMKQGFMKDYDDVSASSLDSNTLNDPYSQEKVENRCTMLKKKSRSNDDVKDCQTNFEKKLTQKNLKGHDELVTDSKSYRAGMKRLEEELFGEETNPSGWYFRRMHHREQCRAKGSNNTSQKFSKRNMNYKMKH